MKVAKPNNDIPWRAPYLLVGTIGALSVASIPAIFLALLFAVPLLDAWRIIAAVLFLPFVWIAREIERDDDA